MPALIMPAPGDTEPAGTPCSVPEGWPSPDCQVLDQLMVLATRYLHSGRRRQAMDIWWSLVLRHAHTAQAYSARESLMQVAQLYESDGMNQAAREIFERLLALESEEDHGRR